MQFCWFQRHFLNQHYDIEILCGFGPKTDSFPSHCTASQIESVLSLSIPFLFSSGCGCTVALWWFDVWLFYPFNPRAMSLVVGSIAFFSYNIPPFPLGLVSYTTDNLPPLPSFRAAKGPLCAFYECQTLIKKNHLVFIFQIFYGKVIQRFLPCCSLCPLSDSLIYIYSYQGNV